VKKKKMKTKNMKPISTLVMVALLTLVAFSTTASAAYIYVPADHTTIQGAITAAVNGDTIIVADGTYIITAAINVNKGVTITGNVANPGNVVVQHSPASTSLNGFEIGAADITIQGFKIIGCHRGVHFGRSDVTSTGCTITNCVFDNNHENAIGEVAAENTTISNNAITNCNMAIEIRLNEATSIAKRTEVTGNTISSCSQSCIQTSNTNDKGINIIGSSATSSNERIQVISNDISGTIWDGIQLTKSGSYYPRYVYVHGNTISDTHGPGISVREVQAAGTADRVEVSGNTISDTYFEGITVQYSSPYTYVYDNTLTGCNYYGLDGTGDWDYASIHVEDSDGYGGSHHTVIDSNTVSDGINGIQVYSDNCEITNNEIHGMGNTYADTKVVYGRTYKNSGILVGSNWGSGDIDPTGVVIEHNDIYDNYWGIFYSADLTNGVTAENNCWRTNTGPHNPTSNPSGTGDDVSDNVDFDPWTLVGEDDCIPEFSTIAIPVASILGLLFFFNYRKHRKQ
jgi:parallel beta-helix repeat protein